MIELLLLEKGIIALNSIICDVNFIFFLSDNMLKIILKAFDLICLCVALNSGNTKFSASRLP